MSKPEVTITLGRTGQVVKRRQTVSNHSWTDSQPLAGGKRSSSDRVGSSADGSLLPMKKRLRGDLGAFGPGYNRVHGDFKYARVGQNDLRLKLMRKEQLKKMQSSAEVQKKMNHRQNMLKNIRPTESSLLRRTSHIEGAGEMLQLKSSRKSYPYYAGAALNPRSAERDLIASQEISPPRHIDKLWRVPPRGPSNASRTGRILDNDALNHSRTAGPAPVTMRATHDAANPGGPPLTVNSLLHSLGLGKYAILFQAEEVDMTALKQMRDNDLKELGIPMGPRKKILLALLSCSKRQQV